MSINQKVALAFSAALYAWAAICTMVVIDNWEKSCAAKTRSTPVTAMMSMVWPIVLPALTFDPSCIVKERP